MIKKQNLLFLTLFSLILVLGVYYITMPEQVFVEDNKEELTEPVVDLIENEYLTALEVEKEDERESLRISLEEILNSSDTSKEDKNNAYLNLKLLNELKGQEELLVKKIKDNYNLDSFIEIEDNNISVVINSSKHDVSLANKIMKSIQEEYDNRMTISIKFQN